MADLTLETMRLLRNHPNLQIKDWFDKALYADELGHPPIRAPLALRNLLQSALARRNYAAGKPAEFEITNAGETLTAYSAGSRRHPITKELAENETATFPTPISSQGRRKS